MSEYIQKGYIRIADIPKLGERTVNVILHVIGG